MLRSMNDLESYAIRATDGDLGHVKDFYFDDQAWVIRYLVVDTGNWLSNRKVLISAVAVERPDWAGKVLPVSITKVTAKWTGGLPGAGRQSCGASRGMMKLPPVRIFITGCPFT